MEKKAVQLQLEETVAKEQASGDTASVKHESTLFAEPIAHIGDFAITNSLMTSWIAVGIIIILSIVIRLKLKTIPRGIQNILEAMIEQALNLADQVTNDRKLSTKIFPLIFTIFIFILINNWLGIIPGVGSIGVIELAHGEQVFVPYLRGSTADINTTLALAIFSVVGANIFGITMIGLWNTFNKYFNIKILFSIFGKVRKDPTILFVAPITFAVGLIELVGEFAKIASLSFRLFGNVFAGEVLLASMSAIMAFVLPVPFLFLEIAVGFIQALIFSILTLVYFTIASVNHDEDHEHDAHSSETVPAEAH